MGTRLLAKRCRLESKCIAFLPSARLKDHHGFINRRPLASGIQGPALTSRGWCVRLAEAVFVTAYVRLINKLSRVRHLRELWCDTLPIGLVSAWDESQCWPVSLASSNTNA